MKHHHIDLTCEENDALVEHLGMFPRSLFPRRITVRQAILLKKEFHRALPPHTLPELDSPLWYAMMKIKRVSEAGCAHHRNVHDMVFTVTRLGGSWIALNDPVGRDLGFAREDGSCRQAIYLCRAHEKWRLRRGVETGAFISEEWDVPGWFREKFWTPSGREDLARILSSGDHCLEFHEGDVYPLLARYIENGGRL